MPDPINKTIETQKPLTKEEEELSIYEKTIKKIKEVGKKTVKELVETGKQILLKPEIEEQLENLEPSGNIHLKYLEELKKIDEKTTTEILSNLQKTSTSEIRSNPLLLTGENEKPEETIKNLKSETAKRIKTYTSWQTNEWYALDYKKVGEDHEWEIGLGDILVDPDIKEVLVFTKEGQLIKAHRDIVSSGGHAGRVGFLDEEGNYVATFTGDKFRILTGKETDIKVPKEVETYMALFNTESAFRKEYQESQKIYETDEELSSYMINPLEKVKISTDMVKNAEKKCEKGVSIKKFAELETKNPDLALLIRKVSQHFGVPEPLLYATFQAESNFTHAIIGDKHLKNVSIGIGQFQPASFKEIAGKKAFKDFMGTYYPNENFEESDKRGTNILADIAASALLIKNLAKQGNIDLSKIKDEEIIYIRARYKGDKAKSLKKTYANNKTAPDEYIKFLKNYHNFKEGYTKLTENQSKDILKIEKHENDKHPEWTTYLINIPKGAKTLIIGSSSVTQMHNKNDKTTGLYGWGSHTARNSFLDIKQKWPKIKKYLDPNPTIIIDGYALNGLLNIQSLKPNNTPEKTAEEDIKDHIEIVKYLETNGVKNIKIATIHPATEAGWGGGIITKEINEFNDILLNKYPQYCLDLTNELNKYKKIHLDSYPGAIAKKIKSMKEKTSDLS